MTTKGLRRSLAATLVLCCLTSQAETLQSRHVEGVLGSSMDLSIAGATSDEAEAAFAAAVAETERLEQLLSSYLDASELSTLNAERSLPELSPELAELIDLCRRWEDRSAGAFSCKLGGVRALWRQAETDQEQPNRRAIRALARTLKQTPLPSADSRPYVLPDPIELDLGGIAKGYIIDRALAAAQAAAPDASGIKVDIGGDGRYAGQPGADASWRVGLAPPEAVDNATVSALALADKAVAASGHRSRFYKIGRRRYSHVLSARDGWPVYQGAASYVVADSALAADVGATVLASLPPGDGFEWAGDQAGLEALMILEAGRQLASDGWRAMELSDVTDAEAPLLTLTYTIPKISAGKYRRPYVAVWITDTERQPVRNLLILGEQERWAQENPRWWRAVGRRDASVLEGYARATRRPGTYEVVWDGRDDRGQPVSGQRFRLHLEAAREHGDHSYRTVDLDLSAPETLELPAEGELGNVAITWSDDLPTSNVASAP
ncbi:MAG: DUF2271 domain-containing protein [Pseudomonadota bacterium]